MINIGLKIELKEKEKRENEINIELDEAIYTNILITNQKVIKLKNNDLAVGNDNKIEFIKNFEITGKMIREKEIIDFTELDNENFCILKSHGIIIYKRMDNGDYEKIKMINFDRPQMNSYNYYKIINISGNNIAILSNTKEEKSFFHFLSYPYYKLNEIKLLDIDDEGDMIQMDNLIIICFALLDCVLIYFYNITNTSLESVNIKSYQTYKKSGRCFKINKNKILVSTIHTGIVFNIKTRQVETFIYDFANLNFLVNVGNYQLVGKKTIISQINFKTGRLYNTYNFNYMKSNIHEKYNILDIIDFGNNRFFVPFLNEYIICLFKYNIN